MAKRTAKVVGENHETWHDEVTGMWWTFDVVWAQLGDVRFEPIELTIRSATHGAGPDGVVSVGGDVHPLRRGPPRGMTADEIRRLPLGTILAHMRAKHADVMLAHADDDDSEQYAALAERWSGGRVPLAEVARVYRDALPRGNPTQAVEEHFGKPRSTVARWIRECRKVGLLGASKPGKAGEA